MAEENKTQHPEFGIVTVYLKELSFKTENPAYTYKDWKPSASVELDSKHHKVGDDHYDVAIMVKVKVTMNNEEIFTAHCTQGGYFTMKNFNEEQLDEMLKSHCLNILFPYARHNISEAVIKASFPPLHINPIDFQGQYLNRKNAPQQKEKSKT
jgi:preprotein translocase subunit SecB